MGRAMRRALILAAMWTGVVVAVLVLWPSRLAAPGCARLVNPPAGCAAEVAAVNDGIWWGQTLPMLQQAELGAMTAPLNFRSTATLDATE